nr:MAG TPA: hypothetical protein [Caudoviricetes sp.]
MHDACTMHAYIDRQTDRERPRCVPRKTRRGRSYVNATSYVYNNVNLTCS